MTEERKYGWAAKGFASFDDPNFGGFESDPVSYRDIEECSLKYVERAALDLPTNSLRELYDTIALELNKRDGVTFRREAGE
jgi:hypothetical protein